MSDRRAQVLGVDLSKDHLDVHLHPSGKTRRVANDPAGHKARLGWLNDVALELVGVEATGADHRRFERMLIAAKLPFAKVNPRQARRFADATGRRRTRSTPRCLPAAVHCAGPRHARPRARCSTSGPRWSPGGD